MLLPSFPVTATDFTLATRNGDYLEEISKDPLIYRGYWSARTIVSLLEISDKLLPKFSEIKVPFFIAHGDEDKICHLDGSKKFYELSRSSDKTLKVYSGGYHSLHWEPDGMGTEVLEAIVKWLEERIES
ncbi:monoglyceride lipase [Nephila pilipes]|uniref:Monoglyceride lipase n=1 Tax=Nephila pilipes TaxID=299642 RepID=A0A8X6QS31_NEPPI|nr:monoglyceride lipase [Nephila pilipes]